jgi:hypothetical protein
MDLNDILISKGTRAALKANGRDDCDHGIQMREGWAEVAKLCGFDPHSRTPARESYEDGYYSGRFGSKRVSA